MLPGATQTWDRTAWCPLYTASARYALASPWPPLGLIAQSTSGGDKQIPDLQHLAIYLLDQALFNGFLCQSVGSSMGQFLILSVSELIGINRDKRLALSHPAVLWPTQTVAAFILMLSRIQLSSTTALLPAPTRHLAEVL